MQLSEWTYVTQCLFVTYQSGQKNAITTAPAGDAPEPTGLSPQNTAGPSMAGTAPAL